MSKDNFFLDNALVILQKLFTDGYTNLSKWISGLLVLIFTIDLLFFIVKFGLGMKEDNKLIAKVLNLGIWFLGVLIFPELMKVIREVFTMIGLTAGKPPDPVSLDYQTMFTGVTGSTVPDVSTKLNEMPMPGTILFQGIENAKPLYDALDNSGFFDLGSRLYYMICWILMMVPYVIMTVQYIVTYLEFFVLTGIGGIFIPFGLMKETRFLAEKFLGAATGHGVKIMLLNFIFSVSNLVLASVSNTLKTSLAPDYILVAITISVLFMVLAQSIPAMAVGILSGTPALTDAHMANTLRTVASVARAVHAGQIIKSLAQGTAQGAVSGAGGTMKAVSAGMAARSNFIQNADAAGLTPARGAGLRAGLGAGMRSLTRSLGASVLSGGGRMVNRLMLGREAALRNQRMKPGTLQNVGRVSSYLKNQLNTGKSDTYLPSKNAAAAALNRSKNSQDKLSPKFPFDVHSPDNTLNLLNQFSSGHLKPGNTSNGDTSAGAEGSPASTLEFNLGNKGDKADAE